MIRFHIVKTLVLALVVALSAGCRVMQTEGFNTYFWTSTPGGNVFLYINGVNKGMLPYISTGVDCDHDEAKRLSLMLYLPSDTYEIQVRDEQQHVVYTETFTASKRGKNVKISTSTDERKGGSKVNVNDKCLVHEIFYNNR